MTAPGCTGFTGDRWLYNEHLNKGMIVKQSVHVKENLQVGCRIIKNGCLLYLKEDKSPVMKTLKSKKITFQCIIRI